MDKQKLIHQLFVGKVADIIGHKKATELLREARLAIENIEPKGNTPIKPTIAQYDKWMADQRACHDYREMYDIWLRFMEDYKMDLIKTHP